MKSLKICYHVSIEIRNVLPTYRIFNSLLLFFLISLITIIDGKCFNSVFPKRCFGTPCTI